MSVNLLDTMDSMKNLCRLCLKFTNPEYLTPLFENDRYAENVVLEWRRTFSFIYNIQGLPDKICRNCKAQAQWILNFHRQCYENDAVLRINNQHKFSQSQCSENRNPPVTYNAEFQGQQKIDFGADEEFIYDATKKFCEYDTQHFENTNYEQEQNALDETEEELVYDAENICDYGTHQDQELENINYDHEQKAFNSGTTEMMDQGRFNEDSAGLIQSQKSANKFGLLEDDNLKEEQLEYMDNQDELTIESDVSLSRSHSKTIPICPICGMSFTKTSNMLRHRKKHENAKPFDCTFPGCDRKFSRKSYRDDHVKTVHEKRFSKCPACNYKSGNRSFVARHILKVHSGSGLIPAEIEL